MGLNPLTIKDLEWPEAKQPELHIYDWGNAGKTFSVVAITRHGQTVQKYTSSSDRSKSTRSFRLDDLPLAVVAYVAEAGVRRGELHVNVNLRFGQVREICLFTGYLTDGRRLSWPPGIFEHMTEGPGLLRSITGTDPAAGAEISETVPTNARWRLRGIRFALVTNATVASRRTSIVFDDGATDLFTIVSNVTQAAGLTYNYHWAPGYPSVGQAIGTTIQLMIPLDLVLFQGWRIRTYTGNLQAADNYGAPQLLVEEWIEE